VPTPTRALATADTTGSGALDFAVARQWGPPAFYANVSPDKGNYLDLEMYRPAAAAAAEDGAGNTGAQSTALQNRFGAPAYGATVKITTPSGSQISELDGGGGHGGYRSFDVHFGLGSYSGPVTAQVEWRDAHGGLHTQTLRLAPGTHTLVLNSDIQEVTSR
jgi:hypothetical protein